jgi:Uma2 family endonuclease
MSTLTAPPPNELTARDLADRLGPMPLRRIRFNPLPGDATEEDVVALRERERRLYELVDGVLLEKIKGFQEACLAAVLIQLLRNFTTPRKLGTVAGADGMVRLAPGLVRIPDVSFVSWDRLPDRRIPSEPVPALAPNLAVEVLIEGNTQQEMDRKL